MFKQIRDMLDEAQKLAKAEAAAASPIVSDNPKTNFDELVKLSEIKNSRFKINGDARFFIIDSKPDWLPFFLWFIFIMAGVISAAAEMNEEFIMLMVPVYLGAMLLFFRLAHTTYEITVDSFAGHISLKSNNPIGRFLKPKIIIYFQDVEELSSSIIFSKMKDGLSSRYNKISIHYKNKKQALIYLANDPLRFIDPEIFILNFSSLISYLKKPG